MLPSGRCCSTKPPGRPAILSSAALLTCSYLSLCWAETCSWFAVLTRNNLLHALEPSVWTLGGALVLVAFMVTVDVPMYLERWYADGGSTVPLAVGLGQIVEQCSKRSATGSAVELSGRL